MTLDTVTLDLALNPVPLGRPRVGPGGAHTPARSVAFAHEFGWLAKASLAETPAIRATLPCTDDVAVTIDLWRRHRGARGDLDNMVKAVLDAGNTLLWADDAQIVELHARLVADGPTVTGRIRLTIAPPTRAITPELEAARCA